MIAPNVKGSALEARFGFVDAKWAQPGMTQLLAALHEDDRKIHDAGILPSSWYPFETFVRVCVTIDQFFGRGDLSMVNEMARYAADVNLPSLYRLFYRIGSVGFILSMGSHLWHDHYDAGELEVESGKNAATLRIVDWPEPHRAHCLSVMGWAARSAEISGGTDVTFAEKSCRAMGHSTCEFYLTWK